MNSWNNKVAQNCKPIFSLRITIVTQHFYDFFQKKTSFTRNCKFPKNPSFRLNAVQIKNKIFERKKKARVGFTFLDDYILYIFPSVSYQESHSIHTQPLNSFHIYTSVSNIGR